MDYGKGHEAMKLEEKKSGKEAMVYYEEHSEIA